MIERAAPATVLLSRGADLSPFAQTYEYQLDGLTDGSSRDSNPARTLAFTSTDWIARIPAFFPEDNIPLKDLTIAVGTGASGSAVVEMYYATPGNHPSGWVPTGSNLLVAGGTVGAGLNTTTNNNLVVAIPAGVQVRRGVPLIVELKRATAATWTILAGAGVSNKFPGWIGTLIDPTPASGPANVVINQFDGASVLAFRTTSDVVIGHPYLMDVNAVSDIRTGQPWLGWKWTQPAGVWERLIQVSTNIRYQGVQANLLDNMRIEWVLMAETGTGILATTRPAVHQVDANLWHTNPYVADIVAADGSYPLLQPGVTYRLFARSMGGGTSSDRYSLRASNSNARRTGNAGCTQSLNPRQGVPVSSSDLGATTTLGAVAVRCGLRLVRVPEIIAA